MTRGTPMHQREFEVEGFGEFPVDMLRYDSCWPASGEDAFQIGNGSWENQRRTVRLRCWRSKGQPVATIARWDSFTWRVVGELLT